MKTIKVGIDNEEYYLINDYKDVDKYRQSLNRLTERTFGFHFEAWYQQGCWSDRYRPYSLLHNDEIIANASANPIDYLIDGELHHTLQIGTVMTDRSYRSKGLSRLLIQSILSEYEGSCEMIYLYGNDSVLDFYPKFGFMRANEYIYTKLLGELHTEDKNKTIFRSLNLREEADKAIISRLLRESRPVSRYSMTGNPGLIMFYLTSVMAENIYYSRELDLAAVISLEGDEMLLVDIFCPCQFSLEAVINSLLSKETKKVKLGFTPIDTSGFTAEPFKEEDSTFFVKGKNLIEKGKFPVLSHA